MAVHGRVIAPDGDGGRIAGEFRSTHDHVLGQIHEDGAGASAACDIVRLLDDPGQVFRLRGEKIMLGARARRPHDVRFLKRVTPHDGRRHLTREHHDPHGIHEGVGEAGDGVRRARARRDDGGTRPAGGLVEPLDGMDRRLLVSAEDVVNRIVQEHVVGVENHAPRVAEDGVHPLALEALEENLGAGQPHGNIPLPREDRSRQVSPRNHPPGRPTLGHRGRVCKRGFLARYAGERQPRSGRTRRRACRRTRSHAQPNSSQRKISALPMNRSAATPS
ncbi:MAG: hypothetical protein H6Q86_2339 [candidate division NC10 bacterium]|nr:hypothetical protein [candidate division NC10 bacterium]